MRNLEAEMAAQELGDPATTLILPVGPTHQPVAPAPVAPAFTDQATTNQATDQTLVDQTTTDVDPVPQKLDRLEEIDAEIVLLGKKMKQLNLKKQILIIGGDYDKNPLGMGQRPYSTNIPVKGDPTILLIPPPVDQVQKQPVDPSQKVDYLSYLLKAYSVSPSHELFACIQAALTNLDLTI